MSTILIVDDHHLSRQFLVALLGFDHHRLLEAADGADALLLARTDPPDLVITDIMMPRMDGYQFVKALRADPALAAIPVIFYSATYTMREANVMALTCGVHWILQKPSGPKAILAKVHEALGLPPPGSVPLAALPMPQLARFSAIDKQLVRGQQDRVANGAPAEDPAAAMQRLSRSQADLQSVGLSLTALVDMGIALAAERDQLCLIETGCQIARHLGVAKFAVAGLPEPGGNGYLHFATDGLDVDAGANLAAAALANGMFSAVLAERRAQRLHGLKGDLAGTELPPGHPQIDSLLVVPITSSSHTYGWLYLADKLGADRFSEVDEEVVMAVAAQLGVAYENLVLFERIGRNLAQLEREGVERQRMADQLRASEMQFRQMAENIHEVFFLIDADQTRILYISPAYERTWGRSCASLYADPWSWADAIHPDDRARVPERESGSAKAPDGDGLVFDHRYRVVQPGGAVRHIHARGFPIRDDAGVMYRIAGIAEDVTERDEQQEKIARLSRIYAMHSGINSAIVRIRERQALLREAARVAVTLGAFSMAWVGIIVAPAEDGRIIEWLQPQPEQVATYELMCDAAQAGSMHPACRAARDMHTIVCNDIGAEPALAQCRSDLCRRGHHALVALPLIVDQRTVAVIMLFASEPDFFVSEEQQLLEQMVGDLSFGLEFIAKDARLSYLAYYDALTGLPNRILFLDRLAHCIKAQQMAGAVCVMAIDLDRFSQLNDAFGRHVGDAVLHMVAERFSAGLPESCVLARIGGDRFTVALSGQRGVDMALLAEQTIKLLDPVFMVGSQALRIAARVGLALYPDDGDDAETLLKHAELALKKAKSGGILALKYAPQMNAALADRLALESALRVALDERQFCLHYQPRIDLASGQIVSAEALIRWQHPARGWVPPVQFISLCEDTGLIVPIGAWVIEAVCAQQAAWRAEGIAIVPVAVNLSAVQLQNAQLMHTIAQAVSANALEQHYLEFELTESMVMNDPEQAIGKLQALKAIGAVLSLDDFGTGYSSLAYLQRFPFDFIKIDRSFVTNITTNPGDAVIVNAVIAMAHSLKLQVVAEGVETQAQLDYLRQQGCDQLQGYLFSAPVAQGEFAAMLRADKRLALAP